MANERSTPEQADRAVEGEGAHEDASPKRAAEQRSPEEVRPPTPDEEKGQAVEQLENPPQAEGPRKRVEEDLEEKR